MNIEIGKISDKYTSLTHQTATAEILKLAREHPDYPITVLVSDEANSGDYGWVYATNVLLLEQIIEARWKNDFSRTVIYCLRSFYNHTCPQTL